MKALVVYESMFGNTQAIARAIAEGIGGGTRAVPIGKVADQDIEGLGLLVIGGPTHAHGMSRVVSRRSAQEDHGEARTGEEVGVREFLARVKPHNGMAAAAFDTRINKPKTLTGSAANGIARLLRRRGYRVAGKGTFLVEGMSGPLVSGELSRARTWGCSLSASAKAA